MKPPLMMKARPYYSALAMVKGTLYLMHAQTHGGPVIRGPRQWVFATVQLPGADWLSDCNKVAQASPLTLHLIIKGIKCIPALTHTHTHRLRQSHTALICSLWYKYSGTVQPLWIPGSCQRLLVRLSHLTFSVLLPIFLAHQWVPL